MTARDPVDDALGALQHERWHDPAHEAALLHRLERVAGQARPRLPARARRWPLVAAGALLGGLATAATVTAADGWRFVASLFGVRIVAVERDGDGDGAIRELILDDGRGQRMLLRPVDAPPVQVVTVERDGGGALRLRVLRDGGLGLVAAFESTDPDVAPAPGQVVLLRRVTPERFRAVLQDEVLRLTPFVAGSAQPTVLLERVPGTRDRYSDGDALLEVVE